MAVVTGILGQLGPVWAAGLLRAGATVVGLDRPGVTVGPPLRSLIDEFGAERLRVISADIRDRSALSDALAECRASGDVPHVLVNNAGMDQPPQRLDRNYRFEDLPDELSSAIVETNLLGTMRATQVFGGAMAAAGRGSIVNIASLYASVAPDPQFYAHLGGDPPFLKPPAYGASKAALVNLTRYLATLWGPRGVRVNALSPGGVRGGQDATFVARFTARVPLGRMALPSDLVGPLVFLASDASAYVTGTELLVDGGFTAW